ncbi:RNA polymerase sigma factor [Actinomadura coerulea]|uniref:RNA polymerase sigma factor n=1 Tax=Actinomadura coerulea TaxID=46159 RepID=UPI00344107B6
MPATSRSSPPRPDPAADDDPTDASLIAASRTEPERFAGLFRRHAPEIMRYATRRLGRDAAEDVVAETFLIAFDRRHRYDAARPDARPWLYGIATNLIRRHRSRSRRSALPGRNLTERSAS